ncbi:ADP-ribosylglycohydrolase family protein [Streptomyces sp. NPDC005283]|uniref:ADP-ribosylglycohydrolase family protein n=1 Tax=Streptomyces sp. NPDC005283 TaxID=3156871 RepID=UPI00345267A5
MTALRLTWVQPEDLLGHELRQAEEDGRDTTEIRTRWQTAGGPGTPSRAGASPTPAPPHLRALAVDLLAELARLSSPLKDAEPTDLSMIHTACPTWPPPPESHPARNLDGPTPTGPPQEAAQLPEGGPPPQDASEAPTAPGAEGDPPPSGSCEAPGPQPALWPYLDSSREAAWAPGSGGLPPGSGTGRSGESHLHGLHAAWLGRAVGCLLGKPVEKLPLIAIRDLARATGNWPLNTWFTARGLPAELAAAHPWNRRSAATSLAENIDGMPEDDDLNYPLLNLVLLQRHGRSFTTDQVAQLWLDELPAGRTFTAERVAYRNLLSGIEPPLTARHRNPFREWIGATIRADVHGWTHPGDPAAAAAQAHRDAVLTHTANGVYGAMFIAATIATAAGGRSDVHQCLRTGLRVVPPRSRLAQAVRFGIDTAHKEPHFDQAVDRLHTVYGQYHWVHVLPNTALLAAALTHADGDFTGSICRAVSGGWDTDSNGATAGSIAGLLAGHPGAIPDRWTAPLKNRLTTSVAGFDGIGFDTLAHLTHQEAFRP